VAAEQGDLAGVLTAGETGFEKWQAQARGWCFNSATGVTTGTITGMHIMLSGTTIPCSAVIDGTSASADNGKVRVTYRNSTGKLTVLTTGAKLVFYNSTCGGIASGDRATLSASYVVTPKQTITSP
jgi:hypothetical protein